MKPPVRVFFALNFEEPIRSKIFAQLVSNIPKNGFSRPTIENIHLTLQFLGNRTKEEIAGLQNSCQELSLFGSFDAELAGIGEFGSRVVWLGVGKGSTDFESLAGQLSEAISIRQKKFHPHVTLARTKGAPAMQVRELVGRLREKNFRQKITVFGFDLMASTLTNGPPAHKKIGSVVFE